MNKELLKKYLNNNCSEEEIDEIVEWTVNEKPDDIELREIIETWRKISESDRVEEQRLSIIFDQIRNKINKDRTPSHSNSAVRNKVTGFLTWVTRAAAVLLIPSLIILSQTLSEKNELSGIINEIKTDSLEIVAPWGARTVVQLTDGTVIHLNSGTKIKYPQVFTGETREVTLSGEAYFEVTHMPEMPFIVKTGNLNVTALGTSFNVRAYPDVKFIETTLVTGKVFLENSEKINGMKYMIPGQHTNYNKANGNLTYSNGNVENYISWINGKTIFKDTPICVVAERLSKMFNVEITVSESIKDYNYTVTIIDEPLFQILDLMTLATPIKYSITPRKKNADGTYTKQKILLDERK